MRYKKEITVLLACTIGATSIAISEENVEPVDFPAQVVPVNPRPIEMPPDARMQSGLYKAEQLARKRFPLLALEISDSKAGEFFPDVSAEVRQELERRQINLRNDLRVHVEIVGQPGGDPVSPALLRAVGAERHVTWRHRVDAWVPIHQLTKLARMLPEDYFMEWAHPDTHDHQGTQTTNSVSYVDGGADGSGIVIAVIDSGYEQLTTARNAGTAPPLSQTTMIDMTGNGFTGSNNHGTGSTESAFAHAPGAQYRLYRISGITQFGSAVDDAIDNGAHIITHSLSRYNQGWADNSGDACDIANTAADAGLLFFTSAGNRARQHWQGTMNPNPSTDWHRFSGNDETIRITLPDGAGGSFWLQWDTSGGSYKYDLYLFDEDFNELEKDTNIFFSNRFKNFSYTNNTGSTQTVNLAVKKRSGGNTTFELFMHGRDGAGDFQHFVSASSITSPSNSTRANVISNAAVNHFNHDSPSGTSGIVMSYSSRGPTNGGRTAPNLSGPTNVSTTCCNGSFGGTSSATPNNAGTAAALWSAHPGFSANAIRWLLYRQASLWKDWGTSGNNNTYGHGGTILVDYVPRTVWLARTAFNFSNNTTLPFYTAQAAYDNVQHNGRILIFPGGNYPEPVTMSGSKAVKIETADSPAILGGP